MRGGSTVYQYKSTHGIGVGSRNCITSVDFEVVIWKKGRCAKSIDTLYFVKIIKLIMYF